MRSNYKQLGQYISEVNVKNTNLEVDLLLGVSITKEFIPSIANTIGTDMSKYKVVRKNQFGYGPITSRNGDKISVALLTMEQCIISTSYRVFEIKDHEELDPEYLMMWFRRPEFDRYARFMSHGSTREAFDWVEMCETELPVPSIEKQRAIVKEYNTIVNRIKLNDQLNKKLEETAQALYKHWFVDFEFPNENGQPYKSSVGKLVYNDELDQEIPDFFSSINIGGNKAQIIQSGIDNYNNKKIYLATRYVHQMNIIKDDEFISYDNRPSRANMQPEIYSLWFAKMKNTRKILYFKNRNNINDYVLSTGFCGIKVDSYNFYYLLVYLMSHSFNLNKDRLCTGTTQESINNDNISQIKIPYPPDNILSEFNKKIKPLFNLIDQKLIENKILARIETLLLSKISKVESLKTEQVL